jgi:hypothetical protein
MTSFTFTSPEGQKYTVNGPDGATPEQAFGVLQQWMGAQGRGKPPSAERGPWEDYAPQAKDEGPWTQYQNQNKAHEDPDGWWKSAPLVKPSSEGDDWWKDAPLVKGPDKTGQPTPQPMSWGDVGQQALTNLPSSAGHFVEGLVQPIVHPLDTARALSDVARGGIAMGGSALAASIPSETLPESTFGERYRHALDTVKAKSGADQGDRVKNRVTNTI